MNQSRLNPERLSQLIYSWNVKFDGSCKGVTVEEIIYRINILNVDCLNSAFDVLCRNLHILLVGKAYEWKDVKTIKCTAFCNALQYQYKDYQNDSDILEIIRERKQKHGESFEALYDEIMGLASKMVRPVEENQL